MPKNLNRSILWDPVRSGGQGPARSRFEIALPVLNEEATLEAAVESLMAYSAEWGSAFVGLRIVDNGSRDRTWEVAKGLALRWPNVRCVQQPKPGRGAALLKAWTDCEAEISLYMDIDLSTNLRHVSDLMHWIDLGHDIVLGSRVHLESKVSRSFFRRALSWVFRFGVRRLFTPLSFDDPQCGFKAVRVARIRSILPKLKSHSWFFDTELLVQAENAGLRIRSVPIEWKESVGSRVSILPAIIQSCVELLHLRFRLLLTIL